MEYTIQALARLAGVSARTLRWYDEIGLLKPSRVADNGYRYYGPAEVDRLQDILSYRALGVGLTQIRACLDDPAYDRLAALRCHLTALEEARNRLEELIRSMQATIGAMERKESVQDETKFEILKRQTVDWQEATYGQEARRRWGDEDVDRAQSAVLSLTWDQHGQWTRLGREIQEQLEAAVTCGASPQGEVGKTITTLHRRWLAFSGNHYEEARHRSLVSLYTDDPRFTAYYDRIVPGCARFLREAVEHWAR